MSTTVGKLIELLSERDKNQEIINHEGESFIHIVNTDNNKLILSTKAPIGECKNCGNYVYPSTEVKDYIGICPTCDENYFEMEILPLPLKEDEE